MGRGGERVDRGRGGLSGVKKEITKTMRKGGNFEDGEDKMGIGR